MFILFWYSDLGKLTREGIPYCVVGLMGASFYGSTLSTYDVDLFVQPEEKTLSRLRKALVELELSEVAVLKAEILKPAPSNEEIIKKRITLIFANPYGLSIDVMTQVSGVEFPKAWKAKKTFLMGREKIYVASLEHIILSKLKAGREKDRIHLKRLKEILKRS